MIDELIDDQWPRSALLFVGEPPDEAMASGDRVIGAVSAGIEPDRLSAAVQAMAAGLAVLDPDLERRRIRLRMESPSGRSAGHSDAA